MALNLLNLYTLTFALFNQIGDMNKELSEIRNNISNVSTTLLPFTNSSNNSVLIPSYKSPIILMEDSEQRNIFDQIFNQVKKETNLNLSDNISSTYQPLSPTCIGSSCAGIPPNSIKSLQEKFARKIPHFTDPAQGIPYPKPLPVIKPIHLVNMKVSNEPENTNTVENYEQSTTAMPSSEFFNSDEPSSEYMLTEASDWTSATEFTTDEVDNYTNTDTSIDYMSPIAYTRTSDSEETSTTLKEGAAQISSSTVLANTISNPSMTISSVATPITSTDTTPVYNGSSTEQTNLMTTGRIVNTSYSTIFFLEKFTISYSQSSETKTTPSILDFSTITSTSKPFTTTETNQGLLMCQAHATLSSTIESDKNEDYSGKIRLLNHNQKERLGKLCWETMFGQELVKLTVMDLAENILSTFLGDFIRALLVRYLNKIWCWDLEKRFPKYADFKIAENILHLVNNQGLVWMGMFFSPGLPLINVVKLMIMMYLRSWAVLTCNVPHEVVFRASRSNNFYLALLLTMLFLCVLPVCYAIVWLEPSWHCGPFSGEKKIYKLFVRSLKKYTHKSLHVFMDYIASPGTVIPLIIILLLIIYYLASLTSALREANVDLKVQLRRERTEERKKMFQMASRRKRGGSDVDSTFAKWKKILQEVPSIRLSDDVAFPDGFDDAKKADDTDVDNGPLKHDEEEKQKIKKIFRSKNKTESTSERKWGNLLRIVPKSQKENVVHKESTSTTSSVKDDSKSETVPEIKISRVQTFEKLLKNAEKLKQPATSKIEEEQGEIMEETRSQIPKDYTVLEVSQKRSNLKQIGKSAKLDSDSDEIEDDVFLESVVVEVPEMPKITESISNRIKRRLKKVLSMGSNEETQQIPTESCKTSAGIPSQAIFSDERTDSKISIDKSGKNDSEPSTIARALSEKDKRVLEYRRAKLVKSESMNMERDKKWRSYMQRRKSSLDEIHLHLPDV